MSASAALNRLTYSRTESVMGLGESSGKAAKQQVIITSKRRNLLEWIVVIALAGLAVALHLRFVTHAGGLWRDETNSINLATLPTLAEVWHFLDYDSFPILYFIVLRVWTTVFGVGNDVALRALGLLIGLGILGALWANARAFRCRLPLLSFALVGVNPMIVRYGDSNRAYGLGILLILLTLRSFWRLVEPPVAPRGGQIAVAAILALLSVQCLYYNSILLFAIAAGAVAVALRTRAWRTVAIVLGIGVLAAVSLLPYVPMFIRMRDWTFLVSYPCNFGWLWRRAGEVLGSPRPGVIWVWVGLVVVGLGVAIAAGTQSILRRRGSGDLESLHLPKDLPAVVLFSAIVLAIGVLGYAGFLRTLNYYTQPWYYITLAVLVASTLDAVFGGWWNTEQPVVSLLVRSLRLIVAISLLGFTAIPSWKEMPKRQTNVDLVAAQIEALSRQGDVIVVPRWECAIPFCRYYRGPAQIVTIPPLEDHRFHRYDLLLAQMKTTDASAPVLARMGEALRSGHRVFLADMLPFPTREVELPALWPPYQDRRGVWHTAPYFQVWTMQAGRFLRAHARRGREIEVPLPIGTQVQGFEELNPGVLEGWH
ncbi:MAG: hypothetical protein ABI233_10515 [Chthoniobacterales bacterium]